MRQLASILSLLWLCTGPRAQAMTECATPLQITERKIENGMGNFAEARRVMRAFRTAHPNTNLEFTLATQDGTSHSVRFSLLPAKEETLLKAALATIVRRGKAMGAEDHRTRPKAEWEEAALENALILHISRASLFQQRCLYTESAEEMDKAHQIAPERGDVWRGAIWANRRTGNTAREQYLKKHPPAGQVAPEES